MSTTAYVDHDLVGIRLDTTDRKLVLGWGDPIEVLGTVSRVSSVSGGSITAGALALAWPQLSFDGNAHADFVSEVVDPVRRLAGRTIDRGAIIGGGIFSGSIADKVTRASRIRRSGYEGMVGLTGARPDSGR